MSKQNFKSHAKRKRQLAKLDKRQAKDQKRAAKRAETSGPVAVAEPAAMLATPLAARPGSPPAPKPMTLAEVVERWKNTRVVKAKAR